jgi:hypothetical protein
MSAFYVPERPAEDPEADEIDRTDPAAEYKNYMDAIAILAKARAESAKEHGYTLNPAWDKLFRASMYLSKRAEGLL